MTLEEFKNTVLDISKKSGDNEEIMTALRTLQTGFEEEVNKAPSSTGPDGKSWEEMYNSTLTELNAAKERYRTRFFEGNAADVPPNDPATVQEQAQQEQAAALNTDFNTLFKEG